VEICTHQVAAIQNRPGHDGHVGAVTATDAILRGAERLQLPNGDVGSLGARPLRHHAVLTGGEDDAIARPYGRQVVAADFETNVLDGVAGEPVVGSAGK